MVRALSRRLIMLVVVLFVATFLTALITSFVRGDTVDAVAPFAPAETKDQIRHDLHLDKPLLERYGAWVGDMVQGDLGKFYTGPATSVDVSDKLFGDSHAFLNTLRLMAYAQLLSLALAIPLGILTAYKAGSLFDKATNSIAFGLLAIPSFVILLVLAYYLGVKQSLYPVTYDDSLAGVNGHLQNYFLPTVSLAVGQVAVYMRLLRSDMIATLQEDFVTMARAKGMSPARILVRHALRPSSLTLLTAAGLNVGTLIGGTVVIEYLYSMPGMGYEIQAALASRQYAALQTYVAIIAVGYIVVNALVDVLYAVLDPRIRHVRSVH